MGYFQVRYDSRVVNYDHRGFITLATEQNGKPSSDTQKVLSHKNLRPDSLTSTIRNGNLTYFH